MHICYIGKASSIHVEKWAGHFINEGHRVSIITDEEWKIRGAEVYNIGEHLSGVHLKYFSAFYQILAKRKAIRKLLKHKIKPDIIHAHYATDYGFLAAVSGFHPFVLTVHGSDILIDCSKHKLTKSFVTYALKKADLVTAPSNFMSKIIKNIAHATPITIQYGVDTTVFKRNDSPSNQNRENTVISVRALNEKYDIQTLINALPLIINKHPETTAIIAGIGDKKDLFTQSMKRNKYEERVKFEGEVPNNKMPELLNKASVYISTSPSDGISISLLEAMSCGLFPIVTNIPGNREVITHNQNGILFETRNVTDLVNKVVSALEDKELQQKAAEMNKKIIEERFSMSKNLSVIEDMYERLLRI